MLSSFEGLDFAPSTSKECLIVLVHLRHHKRPIVRVLHSTLRPCLGIVCMPVRDARSLTLLVGLFIGPTNSSVRKSTIRIDNVHSAQATGGDLMLCGGVQNLLNPAETPPGLLTTCFGWARTGCVVRGAGEAGR